MKNSPLWKKGLLVGIVAVTMIASFSVSAAPVCPPDVGDSYCNPLGTVTDIPTLIKEFLKKLIIVTIPLAGLGIVLAGLYYVFAAVSGNTSKTQAARKMFTYVLIGCLLVVGSLALAEAIMTFIKNLS